MAGFDFALSEHSGRVGRVDHAARRRSSIAHRARMLWGIRRADYRVVRRGWGGAGSWLVHHAVAVATLACNASGFQRAEGAAVGAGLRPSVPVAGSVNPIGIGRSSALRWVSQRVASCRLAALSPRSAAMSAASRTPVKLVRNCGRPVAVVRLSCRVRTAVVGVPQRRWASARRIRR
jgi:hypothetical protein